MTHPDAVVRRRRWRHPLLVLLLAGLTATALHGAAASTGTTYYVATDGR